MSFRLFAGRKLKNTDVCLIFFSLTVLAMTVIPFFLLCRYNHPGDFDNWWIFRLLLDKKGPDLSFSSFFSFRGGINFANFFFSGLYNHPEGMSEGLFYSFLKVYHLSAAFYVALFWAASSILFFSLDRAYFHFGGCRSLFFYSLFIYLIFNSVHYPTMAFFDLVSSSGYNAGLAYFLLFLSFSVLAYCAEGRKLVIYGALSFLSFIFCIFSMEYFPFICGCFSFSFMLHSLVKRRRINFLHTAFLVICLIVFARNFLTVRTLVTPDADGFVGKYTGGTNSGLTLAVTMREMLLSVGIYFSRYFRQLVSQRRYLPSVVLLSLASAFALRKRGLGFSPLAVLPFFLIILGTAAIFSFATPDVFVMPRYAWTLYVLIFLYLIALFTSLFRSFFALFDKSVASDSEGDFVRVRDGACAVRRIFSRMTASRKSLLAFTACGTLVFCFFSLKDSMSTVANAWKDLLKGDAAAYNKEMLDRYDKIFSSEADEPVYLIPIVHRPKSLFVRDSMEFEWERDAYRSFFGNKKLYFKVGDQILR